MDSITLKNRIVNRFKQKQTGYVLLKIDKHTKLKIEYMYGAKYCLKRKNNKGVKVLSVLCDINKLVELILKEKANKFNKFKPK